MDESPVNKANAFATAAEEYAEQGNLSMAMEAHFRAAEQFLIATNFTTDQEPAATGARLPPNYPQSKYSPVRPHIPSLNQRTTPSSMKGTVGSHSQHLPQTASPLAAYPANSGPSDGDLYGSRNYFLGQESGSILGNSQGVVGTGSPAAGYVLSNPAPATVPVESLDASEAGRRSIEKSYFIMNSQANDADDDPEDPFNKFWDVVESLVQKVSITGPIAFATAPIPSANAPVPPSSALAPLEYQQTIPEYAHQDSSWGNPPDGVRHEPNPRDMSDTMKTTSILNSYFMVPNGDKIGSSVLPVSSPAGSDHERSGPQSTFAGASPAARFGGENVVFGDPSASIDSNYFGQARTANADTAAEVDVGRASEAIGGKVESTGSFSSGILTSASSVTKPSVATVNRTADELMAENDELRTTIDALTKRLAVMEKAWEENSVLRNSIIQFRQDVQKQAKRYKQSPLGLSRQYSTPASGKHVGTMTDPMDTDLQSRVAELEAELEKCKQENEAQTLVMNKYKDRWERLKESARKKKESKESFNPSESVGSSSTREDSTPSNELSSNGSPAHVCSSPTTHSTGTYDARRKSFGPSEPSPGSSSPHSVVARPASTIVPILSKTTSLSMVPSSSEGAKGLANIGGGYSPPHVVTRPKSTSITFSKKIESQPPVPPSPNRSVSNSVISGQSLFFSATSGAGFE
ncbi:uncharacterized protein BJ171DRAFT_581132 [Polychytrium aggregatum]|uniref:uncharacterized protein n=1 Tax=Polychytrium aggregatum TaxID=110093 RepID=UPI0022FDD3DF|nr:uncharacterized protein BJ171DRAFT_581132 [Polychytrium aggregatum]KAI9205455.1 hypothetical protein BJ171DRAFT_581132 [Polychytrium aggregatum]